MPGERDLSALLTHMEPVMAPGRYLFCTLPPGTAVPDEIAPLMTFREAEGETLIATAEEAVRAGLNGTFPSRLVTLNVHSSVEAVGFLAVITRVFGDAGIGVNPVSGYFHDHLFVPEERAEEALALLRELSGRVL